MRLARDNTRLYRDVNIAPFWIEEEPPGVVTGLRRRSFQQIVKHMDGRASKQMSGHSGQTASSHWMGISVLPARAHSASDGPPEDEQNSPFFNNL